jgi:hypothetical protein
MRKWKPKLKDEDPVDTLDTEVTKISKKLAETRKAALEKLSGSRRRKAVPEPDVVPPGFSKFKNGKVLNLARKSKGPTGNDNAICSLSKQNVIVVRQDVVISRTI